MFWQKNKKGKKEAPIMAAVDTAQIKKQLEDATNLVKKATTKITELQTQVTQKGKEAEELQTQLTEKTKENTELREQLEQLRTQVNNAISQGASGLDEAAKKLKEVLEQ